MWLETTVMSFVIRVVVMVPEVQVGLDGFNRELKVFDEEVK